MFENLKSSRASHVDMLHSGNQSISEKHSRSMIVLTMQGHIKAGAEAAEAPDPPRKIGPPFLASLYSQQNIFERFDKTSKRLQDSRFYLNRHTTINILSSLKTFVQNLRSEFNEIGQKCKVLYQTDA